MRRLLAAFALLALTLTGCSDVVDGTGSEATASGDFPTTSPGPTDSTGPTGSTPTGSPTTSGPTTSSTSSPPISFSCPDITYASARMSFTCISDQMRVGDGKVFSIIMAQTVETASGWRMEMGAKRYDGTATTFPAISADVRGDLLRSGGYGTNPTYDLDSVNYTTISGKPAYTTFDTVTVDPTYAAAKKSAVKIEKRWLVIVEFEPGEYTTWYASIPDIAQQYWAQVPTSIASIKINA